MADVIIEGIRLTNVHEPFQCSGRPCVIHNPSPHLMRSWQLNWRDDRGLFERICKHGVGHPDPDQFQYWVETGQAFMGAHGCCGCCHPADFIEGEVVEGEIVE